MVASRLSDFQNYFDLEALGQEPRWITTFDARDGWGRIEHPIPYPPGMPISGAQAEKLRHAAGYYLAYDIDEQVCLHRHESNGTWLIAVFLSDEILEFLVFDNASLVEFAGKLKPLFELSQVEASGVEARSTRR
jgi:hypothetical protein